MIRITFCNIFGYITYFRFGNYSDVMTYNYSIYVMVSFRVDKASNYLLMPSWMWVSFVISLNYASILAD
tara:strand:+ start:2884 stop:3090 length:207 start_codon:yes stop_codon:yes gene_type:complete